MKLPGRLRSTTLGDVFGVLHRAQASGTLELIEVDPPAIGRRHAVEFDLGLVAAVETALPCSRLGEILETEGFLAAQAIRRLLTRMQQHPARQCGELLIEEALVTRDLVQAALRHQLRLRIDVLFRIKDAQLGFRVPRPRMKAPAEPVPLSPHEFLYGRERARLRQRPPRPASRAQSALPRASAAHEIDPAR
ncbi:MAG TPA: DUF4388 domain-containing protein, partial [Polyangiaceae bacterium]|nr:DUF4388 domain-containing protein [Polyangiaceae bacterium]